MNGDDETIRAARAGAVIVVGSVSVDVTSFSQRLPRRGETILGDAVSVVLGGKGANQAVAAARGGARTELVGCIGDDVFRALVLEGLRADGVGLAHLQTVPGATGLAHIRVDASGENDIVVLPQANAALDAASVTSAVEALAPESAVLLTQLETPFETTLAALRAGRAGGLITVLDPAPAAQLPDAVWPLVDIVTPNETEATLITGVEVTDAASAEAAGRWFLDRGASTALITLASAGAVLVTAGGTRTLTPHRVEVVDTTAAGDAFAGHLGAALASGRELLPALEIAMAAGALAVTRRGASPSIPTAADVEDLLART